jgi:hypothetical protein
MTHERMYAVESFETVLDLCTIEAKYLGNDSRVKRQALDTRRHKQAPIGIVQPIDLAVNQAAHRFRKVGLDIRERSDQLPAALLLRLC